MNMLHKRAAGLAMAAIVMAAAVAAAKGCWFRPDLYAVSGQTMGTKYTIKIVAPPAEKRVVRDAFAAADAVLRDIDAKMSTYRQDSELSAFNRLQSTEPFVFSDDVFFLIQFAQRISKATDGALDITVGPLVNAWGFGPQKRPTRVLTDADLDPLRERVGYAMLTLDPAAKTVRKARPDIQCDLSAIAIGYSVDKVSLLLEAQGFARYMVDVGGEVRTRGFNADDAPWKIAIEKPIAEGRAIQTVLSLSGLSISTSGDYRNYYEENGVRLSHEIDPKTGRPISHRLASASVVAQECAFTDGYATAFMVMGPERAYDFAVQNDIAALFLIHDDAAPGGFVAKASPAFERLAAP